jgi:hypothetical protein
MAVCCAHGRHQLKSIQRLTARVHLLKHHADRFFRCARTG